MHARWATGAGRRSRSTWSTRTAGTAGGRALDGHGVHDGPGAHGGARHGVGLRDRPDDAAATGALAALLDAAPTPEHRRCVLAAARAGHPARTVAAFAAHVASLDAGRLRLALDPLAQPHGLLRQQSPTTCGSAALVVARMLVDPVHALLVLDGLDVTTGGRWGGDVRSRLAAQEQAVKRRTNGVRGPRGPGVPWPRALGTPPWGARREMDGVAGRPGTRYRVVPIDSDSVPARAAAHATLVDAASAGFAVPVYVGDDALPRHVVLVVGTTAAGPAGGDLRIFDPATGAVGHVPGAAFVHGRLAVSGWERPWVAVVPRSVAVSNWRSSSDHHKWDSGDTAAAESQQ